MTPPVPTAWVGREAGLDHGLDVFSQPEATPWTQCGMDTVSVSSAGRSGDSSQVPSVSSLLRNGGVTEKPAK